MRLGPETEHQEKMDANLKEDIKSTETSEQKQKPSKQKQMQEMMRTSQERIETKMDANLRENIVEIKDWQKEIMSCQDAMETNLEKIEPNSGEVDTIVEWQEIPNKELAIHSLRACWNERTAC